MAMMEGHLKRTLSQIYNSALANIQLYNRDPDKETWPVYLMS